MVELARRYVVMPLATEAPFDPADPDGVFVLKPWKDPAALRALRAYRDSCFPELSRDLDAWISAIEAGPTVRGDVGRRNEPFARMASVSSSMGAEPPTVVSKPPPQKRSPLGVKTARSTDRAKIATAPRPTVKPKSIARAAAATRTKGAAKTASTAQVPTSKTSAAGRAQSSGAIKQGAARRPPPRKQVKKRRR